MTSPTSSVSFSPLGPGVSGDGRQICDRRSGSAVSKPLAIDLFCGLFGWSDGLLAEGWEVIGFDIKDMHSNFGLVRPAEKRLVIQNVLTLHGSQFRTADLIVASPPCQAYSYRAMPWKKAKALPPPDNSLFDACFRIQGEACEAAGRHIPLVVENVRGAQKWVGRARWNFGSYYVWGDVPALMPVTFSGFKSSGMNWSDQTKRGQDFTRIAGKQAIEAAEGRKGAGAGAAWFDGNLCQLPSSSSRRKFASAMIAKIPLPLSRHIGATFYPRRKEVAA
jgi:hypothetical protein